MPDTARRLRRRRPRTSFPRSLRARGRRRARRRRISQRCYRDRWPETLSSQSRCRGSLMTREDISGLNWEKGHGLLPAIVQNSSTGTVLMTGYVNKEALHLMLERREVVLYSRTRQRLWIKGETSGNHIRLERIVPDCDRDALLVLALPSGPVCHTGALTCFPGAQPGS